MVYYNKVDLGTVFAILMLKMQVFCLSDKTLTKANSTIT